MSNIKEPYSISVWEEELIPESQWYVKGETKLTEEEYNKLEDKQGYELQTIMEHYEEIQGIIIGAHDMNSIYGTVNPVLKENINGSIELTFGLYYKVFDPDALEFCINPFTQLLVNEAKIKLYYREKWYDLVIKNCVEDSENFLFNYTCRDIYINELNKNGFKVELDTELENNQDTVTNLAETILLDTDWQIDKNGSQIIVETKIEPLFIGTLNQDVTVVRVNDYTPDEYANMDGQWEFNAEQNEQPVSQIIIAAGSKVLFFYSDIVENVKHPQFLARLDKKGAIKYKTIDPDTESGVKEYLTDANEDIIINAYNYQIVSPSVYYIDSETEYNIPSVTEEKVDIYNYARGEKVIKRQLSGYDPDLDKFIFKFYKKDDDNNTIEYYGYTKTEHLTSDLAQNYLANSDNFTSLDSGWYFDGIPARTVKTQGKEKIAAYSGQIFSVSDLTTDDVNLKNKQESLLVLQLRDEDDPETRIYYPDSQGEFYLIEKERYVKIYSSEGQLFEDKISTQVAEEYKKNNPEATTEEVEQIVLNALGQKRYSYIFEKYQQNSEGDYYKVAETVYKNVSSPEAKAFEGSIRAWVYDQRDYYVEGYADKSDDELDDIINEALLSSRYSYRSRYAINNGVAANRKIIENLTPGEEYLFAVSLGKFIGDVGPSYGRTIQYGGKIPTEFYKFSASEQYYDFVKTAVQETLGEDVNKWSDKYKKHAHYLSHPEYEKIYTETYKKETQDSEKDYENRFLFGLNFVNKEARDLWRSGGYKFRSKIFLEYLRDNKKFITTEGSSNKIGICEYLAQEISKKANEVGTPTRQLYDILLQKKEDTNQFIGVYPTMVQLAVNDAEEKQKEIFTIDGFWEPMAYENTMFPSFDENTEDIASMCFSFNESLFNAIYQGLKQAFMKITGQIEISANLTVKKYSWDNDKINQKDLANNIETLLKTIYKAAYEEGKFLNVYDKAKEYKMPGLLGQDGGEIYYAYKARWEAAAAEKAAEKAKESVENIDRLFNLPLCIKAIGLDTSSPTDANLEGCYRKLIALAKHIQEKTIDFKQNYSIEQIGKTEYNKALMLKYSSWVQDFLNNYTDPEEIKSMEHVGEDGFKLYGQYYYVNFLPDFLKAWVSEQEVGTYVLAEDKYELNNGEMLKEVIEIGDSDVTDNDLINGQSLIPQFDTISAINKITNPTAKHFINGLYTTLPNDAHSVAIKTSYNPYTNEGDDSAGGYVFDRNEEVIRLFDPERDMIGATYKPVKNDDGDYIYDVFEQVYRPFRNWSVTEKRNPVTLEEDDNNGVYGDITHHPIKAFDGHLGAWQETPTRYHMVRLREDPLDKEKYHYLFKDIKITEAGHHNDTAYYYTVTYPAGYQTDSYEEDSKGQYVLSSEVVRPKRADLCIKIIGEDAYWHLLGGASSEEELYQITDNKNKTFWDTIKSWFSGDDELNNSRVYENGESGLFVSNGYKEGYYDEDTDSVRVYSIGDQLITVPVGSNIENEAETKNAKEKGLIDISEKKDESSDEEQPIPTHRYIKYKPWYWRHWGAKRYNYRPKICVQKTVNGVIIFKPFNKVEDAISDDYRVMTIEEYNDFYNKLDEKEKTQAKVAFYLKEPKRWYRIAKDIDYGTRKYRMELQDKKKKEYWVESPNGEDYLRHYKLGDGETKLWDGHFGRWIDCFKANQRPAEEKLDSDSGWYENSEYPGLLVSYKDDRVDKKVLPTYYLSYNDIMIPWDARVLNRDKRFTRQRFSYKKEEHDNLYVLSDDVYMTLNDYYDNNGFKETLDYSGLKVSFVFNFQYDATNFSIKLPEKREDFLSFNLDNAPDGIIDLVVEKTDEIETKERWVYWIDTVKKQFSLMENPLQTVGMLFETSREPDEKGKVKPYPFLGMQMFKHIPYEKKKKDIEIKRFELDETGVIIEDKIIIKDKQYDRIENAVIDIYNQLFGDYEGGQTLLQSEDYNYIKETLQLNNRYATMVSKLFNDYGYVWDIMEPDVIEVVNSKSIKIPLFPGEAVDAKDLFRTLYYIYDPEKVTDINDVVYEYVGTEPLYDEATNPKGMFKIAYDEQCQKIRSIKGKESNYFKLLQDCCDTFDCWFEPVIEHEKDGRVKYINKKVYIENKLTTEDEPQMYIGEEAKCRTLDDKIAWYLKRFGYGTTNSRIKEVVDENNNLVFPIQYESNGIKFEDEDQIELNELNRLSHIIANLTFQYITVPDKKIRFRRYVGEENWNGFKYGVNLNHVKRTVDSNQISTRVIVKPNSNEHAKDNFCTIQRAQDNPLKENFLYDFSYYIQQGLLDRRNLNNDLYTNLNSKLNYYNELGRLNKDNDKIIEELSTCLSDLDEVKANYETAVLKRDAAAEEINKLALTFTSNYDTYGQIMDIPWTPNKSQEYTRKKQTVAPETIIETTITMANNEILNVTIDIPKTATAVDYPKYNDALRTLLDQMDVYQEEYSQSVVDVEKYEADKKRIEARIIELQDKQRIIVDKKNELNKLFYHKYSRYIQEGSWVDENYIDDNLYYLDALSVMRTSCKPKITYDIGVIDISAALEYEEDRIVLETKLGDRTYVEDIEFFGYKDDGITPYQELVIVTEKIYNLNDPSQNKIKVKNYSTQFDDLFQRIAATSQTLQFNEGSYSRAASIINDNGTIDSELLQKSIEDGGVIVWNAKNEIIEEDNTGLTIKNSINANMIKLVSQGIILSTDGGSTWKTAITGAGINADLLTTGRIDTKMLFIGNSDKPNFFWNSLGLSAFRIEDDKIDYSSFVRLDQYGVYGIKNYKSRDKTKLSLNDTFAPRSTSEIINDEDAIFGLTWDGFFLNASNGTGRVTIGTEQDFKMSERSVTDGLWKDKVIIGRLQDNSGIGYYGFRLKNDDGQIVMETNDTGELYLKRKLRISNFNDAISKDAIRYISQNYSEDRVYEEYYKLYYEKDNQVYLELFSEKPKNVLDKDNLIMRVKIEPNDFTEGQNLIYNELKIEKKYYIKYYEKKVVKQVEVDGNLVQKKYIEYYLYNELEELTSNTFIVSVELDDEIVYDEVRKIEEEIKFTNVIYSGYYEKYVVKNNKKYVEYHIKESNGVGLNETTKITEKEVGDNWKDLISKPQDRVTLGIIDIYDRSNNYAKVSFLKGAYSSKEYLTKVFSVKANDTLITDQLNLRDIRGLIEENEQLAIFDNGALFAQNAYIEGTINATSGKFENGILGNLSVQGVLTLDSGSIKDKTGQWEIEGNGTAHFKNAIISGKLQSTIFEHNEIQTISGGMLIASGIKVKKTNILEEKEQSKIVQIILDSSTFPYNFSLLNNQEQHNTTQLSEKEKQSQQLPKVLIFKDYNILFNEGIENSTYTVIETGEYEEGETKDKYVFIKVEVFNNSNSLENLENKGTVIFLKNSKTNIDQTFIAINSLNTSGFFPRESISIMDISLPVKTGLKALFGYFEDRYFQDSDDKFLSRMCGKYGLYCDNVYIKGSMVSNTDGYIAGIDTTNEVSVKINENLSESAVFFAGQHTSEMDKLNFYVTRTGKLYAQDAYLKNGYFTGTIETSQIIGNGKENYALEILGNSTQKALRFASHQASEDRMEEVTEYFSLTTSGCQFFNRKFYTLENDKLVEKNVSLLSILYNTTQQGIGMFFNEEKTEDNKQDLSCYKLNFKENKEGEIDILYYSQPLVTINKTGFHVLNNNDLGEYCECVEVTNSRNETIGVNFNLK